MQGGKSLVVQAEHMKFVGFRQTLALYGSWDKWKGGVCSLSVLGIARKRMICPSAPFPSFVEMVIPNISTGAKGW